MPCSSRIVVRQGVALHAFSTFRIGGPARYFAVVRTAEELQQLLVAYAGVPRLIFGKGSNCLFDDRGFNGLAILNKMETCTMEGEVVHAGAGYSFSLLGIKTARKGYGGLEFAAGIPGSVGGAIFMNAGASGQETQDVLVSVETLTPEGVVRILPKEKLSFAYRVSPFQENGDIILGATFALKKTQQAKDVQLRLVRYRQRTQPYREASAGCAFRNPPEISAGALIESCGLKGTNIGGAEVSCTHANFIVNRGGARAQDVRALIERVQNVVCAQKGILLEREIRYIPYDVSC